MHWVALVHDTHQSMTPTYLSQMRKTLIVERSASFSGWHPDVPRKCEMCCIHLPGITLFMSMLEYVKYFHDSS